MEFTTTSASAMETAPFGGPLRHGCPDVPLGVRSYSAPSATPFTFESWLYCRPLAFGAPPPAVPIHGSTAIASAMEIAPLREPTVGSDGVHMSAKSHGFSGSRWPPSTRLGPTSLPSPQPSASVSALAGLVP